MDGPGHLLSLKVMRVSRPAIASAWQPFYSSSPSFSAHSTASITSLQGKTPLPGHPKTLRDLTHATELLTLPSSFGAIQLGETFSSCLCVNNEANVDIDAVILKVDMQTASTKVQIAELGGPDHILAAGDTLENMIHHEIKELGQHVLACTVTYSLPLNARHPPGPSEDVSDPTLQTFRKFYKFAVTNPLSVKTKVHIPRSPSALLSATERGKIFLEVHIQNLTQEPMWFERMSLEAVDGWTVEDDNAVGPCSVKESIISESTELVQPQDMRQYVYTMTPKFTSSFPVVRTPGSIPLGRLDISWRSFFGEPGRLLTSMLYRRIPLPAPVQTASAIPTYLQSSTTAPSGVAPRPDSPQHALSRSSTPPIRSGSPFRSRTGTPSVSTRPQSPGPVPASASHHPAASSQVALPTTAQRPDLDIDLTIRHIPRHSIVIENPFTIGCKLTISASVPSPGNGKRAHRIISLVVQHVQSGRATSNFLLESNSATFKACLPNGLALAPPSSISWQSTFTDEKTLVTSPEHHGTDSEGQVDRHREETSQNTVMLPTPFTNREGGRQFENSRGVLFLGPSAIFLEPIRLSGIADGQGGDADADTARVEAAQEFDLSYVPLVPGFSSVGGLRVILIEDQVVDEDQPMSSNAKGRPIVDQNDISGIRRSTETQILKEWDVIGEIWVKT